ncbi:hypothetical protein Pan44_53490 [Caulifigura coniformis]|uniref:Prepilin-type N-terminal cleavage/methylation domain-containing protein n=1 Tax=Caulifigura coniformis TaxID=2527983 RepID=A0A517SMC8_9PLAN|nr:hypothetical protein Pan44_53490 [Caulifigura coniformis]
MTFSHRPAHKPPPRVAFTLVELMAVLVLTGLVAVSVGYSLRPSLAAAGQVSAIQQLRAIDRTIREQCVKSGSARDLWMTGLGHLELRVSETEESKVLETRLPILRVLTSKSESTGEAIGLRYRPDGSSPSFALEIGTPSIASRFLLFLGGSGQALELDNKAAVDELLAVLRTHN